MLKLYGDGIHDDLPAIQEMMDSEQFSQMGTSDCVSQMGTSDCVKTHCILHPNMI